MNTRTRYEAAPIGRPSEFTQETADAICHRISEGESLRQVCRDADMPDRSTVYKWLRAIPSFAGQYRRARELLVEHWADELVDIADDTALDTVTKVTPQGREYEAVDHEHIQRSKLRVDTRKWLMSKLCPRQYGDRVEHDVRGQIEHDHQHRLDDREVVRRLALFLVEAPAALEVLAPPAGQDEESRADE
jgi:transposase-like protein